MIFPPYLHPGDCIGIVAPARKISPKEVKAAIDFLELHHFRVAVGKNLFAKQFQFAGSDSDGYRITEQASCTRHADIGCGSHQNGSIPFVWHGISAVLYTDVGDSRPPACRLYKEAFLPAGFDHDCRCRIIHDTCYAVLSMTEA